MATLITSKPSMMSFPSALNRMGTFPIDISSVWYSYDDAVAYATQTNFKPTYQDQTGLPYVGQILTVVETAEDGTTSVTAYSIQNEAGDLAQVGTVTLADDASIAITTKIDEKTNKEVEVLTLYGFADAEEGEFAVVGADGKLDWKKISADEVTITNDEGTLALKGIKELTWKEGEGEDAKDVAVYQPKLVKKDGKVTLTWEIPSAVTVDGLNTRLQTAEENISEMSGVVGEHTTKIGEIEDKFNNYYTKENIDEKISSVFKFKGVKTYKSELPTTGQAIGDVWLVIYDGDAPVEGEANILPVSNSEYVWTSENKWENLGDDIVDLSNYYTKAEVNTELAKKGAVDKVEDGINDWTVKVTDAKGNVTHAKAKVVNASNEAAGLVKGDGTNVSIADGVITVNKAGHAAEATHATNADNATEASHADTADYATEAGHANTADEAGRAATAGHATEAGKVTNALKIKINKETTYSFDGSTADVTVPLDNYYTKGEADNNFMTETKTNDAITAVTNPLADEIEAIKGEIPETEGYVLPNLVNVGARLDAHDEAIEGLGTQVETANETATQASKDAAKAGEDAAKATQTANDAKTKAELALDTADAADDLANAAKTKAELALDTANAADGLANAAKIRAELAVDTASTAKDTADTANAQATANKSAIEALQAEDTTIKGLVKANTSKVTNLENTVAAGLADRYTIAQTNTYVAEQIAAIDHLKREVVESLPGTPDANTIYMVPTTEIINKSFSGTTAEGIPSNQFNKIYDIFQSGSTFTIVYNGVKYSNVKAVQTTSSEVEGYNTYRATFGEHYLEYTLGDFRFDVQDSTPYSISWNGYPENNYYVEWIYINQKWEKIGTSEVDLSNYLTKDGAADNTTIGGVKTAEVVANAAKTAEWDQISGKPKGELINTERITITAGNTSVKWTQAVGDMLAAKTFISYQAYLENEEVIIGHKTDGGIVHIFEIASAQTSNIIIDINYTSFI